jgi:DNA repair protein RadC
MPKIATMDAQEVIPTTGILPAKVHIRKWPKSERPREKLLARGACRRLLEPLKVTSALTAPAVARTFLLAQLWNRPYEALCGLFLDRRRRLISF